MEEVKIALSQIHPLKAPGPDGLGAYFFQKFEAICGGALCRMVMAVLNGGRFPEGVNHTSITLIPKGANPRSFADFRPISLCNVSYKIVSKCIVNRLKKWMTLLVSETQSAFTTGRSIFDNIMLAYELVDSMKKHTTGRVGHLAIKLDIRKAYDSLEWPYIEACLTALGFDKAWIKMVMYCIKSVSYCVNVNGQRTETFSPSRGIRQGDPLSPLLYVLCTEGLASLLRKNSAMGEFEGVAVSRGGEKLSHLFFADDSLVFARASSINCFRLKEMLELYGRASGQGINFDKSSLFCSSNVGRDLENHVRQCLGIKRSMQDGAYLGLPIVIGRKKMGTFAFIKDKVTKKLNGWQGKFLTKAGKEVLIKSVLQAMPSYAMSVFKLPAKLCADIEGICSRFLWGGSVDLRKIHWKSWEKLCGSKSEGGLGFRRLEAMNMSLLARQCWQLIAKPESMLGRVLKAKYYPNSSFLDASEVGTCSFLWKGLLWARQVIVNGGRWRIGNGKNVSISMDRWVSGVRNNRVVIDPIEGRIPEKVCDLFKDSSHRWNEQLIELLFSKEQGDFIKAIPLCEGEVEDQWCWDENAKGIYTVRSGYSVAWQILFGDAVSMPGLCDGSIWKVIWKASVAPKIRFYLWQLASNVLPSKFNLVNRGVAIADVCDTCLDGSENCLHMVRECSWSQQVWRLIGLERVLTLGGTDCDSWMIKCFRLLDEEQSVLFMIACWVIWRNRNRVVFDNVCGTWMVAVKQIMSMAYANRSNDSGETSNDKGVRGPVKWSKPVGDMVKLNCDATFLGEGKESFYGVVARDSAGEMLLAACGSLGLVESVLQAETQACLRAVGWAKLLNLGKAQIEGDCLKMIQAVKDPSASFARCGLLIDQLKTTKLDNGSSFNFSHVKRDGNKVAHLLAHHYNELLCFDCELLPSVIGAAVKFDSLI